MAHRHSNLIDVVLAWAHRTVSTDIKVRDGQGLLALKDSRGRFDYVFDAVVEDLKVKRDIAIALGVNPTKANQPLADFHEEVKQARARDTLAWHEAQAAKARRKAGLADKAA